MHRVALKTLFESAGKAFGAIVGVAAAGTLIFAQLGLYAGFRKMASALAVQSGGHVWVMASGTQVLENAAPIGERARQRLATHRCVAHVRGLIVDYAQVRAPTGELVTAQVVGVDAHSGDRLVPWSVTHGVASALEEPARVAVDMGDAKKLGITRPVLGAPLELGGDRVTVAALTHGIRPFTLTPYVFARLGLARRLTHRRADQVSYWIADLLDPACAPAVLAHVERDGDLDAHTAEEFAGMTESFWVESSGIGSMLRFGAALALLVGMIVIGQTLTAITRSHRRELGTLKALGASERELCGFVVWQAAVLAMAGATLALAATFVLRAVTFDFGLEMALSPAVLSMGGAAITLMCALASVGSLRTVLALDAHEVLK